MITDTWLNISTLKANGLLISGEVYVITDLQNMELVGRTAYTFYDMGHYQ